MTRRARAFLTLGRSDRPTADARALLLVPAKAIEKEPPRHRAHRGGGSETEAFAPVDQPLNFEVDEQARRTFAPSRRSDDFTRQRIRFHDIRCLHLYSCSFSVSSVPLWFNCPVRIFDYLCKARWTKRSTDGGVRLRASGPEG